MHTLKRILWYMNYISILKSMWWTNQMRFVGGLCKAIHTCRICHYFSTGTHGGAPGAKVAGCSPYPSHQQIPHICLPCYPPPMSWASQGNTCSDLEAPGLMLLSFAAEGGKPHSFPWPWAGVTTYRRSLSAHALLASDNGLQLPVTSTCPPGNHFKAEGVSTSPGKPC